MIRAIFVLVKMALFVAAVVWVAENPGTISIDWMNYKLTFHVGFFLISLVALVVLGILLFSMFKVFLDLPKNLGRYRDITSKEKGINALTLGLTAVAAGDAKVAAYQAYRADKFLSEDEPLSLLLKAQAARLNGEELEAARAFMALLEHQNGSFLGVRGLLQNALDSGDYEGALELAHRALDDYPKQGWLLCIAYDLEVRLRNWKSARNLLYRAEKAGAIASNKANSDRVAMMLAEADEAREAGDEATYFRKLNEAFKLDKHFIPSVLRLAKMYIDRKKYKAAVTIIQNAWKITPHPELTDLWDKARPLTRDGDNMARVRWYEKLLDLNSESVIGLQVLARVLIDEGLWGEARKKLEKAEGIRPNVKLYKLWARLEEVATHDSNAVRGWLEKAADAPRERAWICSETGRVYKEWVPISDQGFFNTIIWDFPDGRVVSSMTIGRSPHMAMPLLASS